MYFISPELFSYSNHYQIFAISNENCTLAWGYKDEAVLTIIDVQISCDIKNEENAIFAVIDVELLLFY